MKLLDVLPIFEQRKNLELNPKISLYDHLKQYRRNGNIHISFTDVPMLRNFPLSEYDNTPYGIYAYPLQQVWEVYHIGKTKKVDELPFAIKKKYIHILEWNGSGKFINMPEYSSTDLNVDIRKLRANYQNVSNDEINKCGTELINAVYGNGGRFVKGIDVDKITHITMDMFVFDVDEYSQEYNLLVNKIKPFEKKYNNSLIDFDVLLMKVRQSFTDDNKSPMKTFWRLTQWLSNYGKDPYADEVIRRDVFHDNKVRTVYDLPRKWNTILRDLGYAGFVDHGQKIIYEDEPYQTVFLGTSFCKLHGTILNKHYINPKKVLETVGTAYYFNALKNDPTNKLSNKVLNYLAENEAIATKCLDYIDNDSEILKIING